MSLDLEMMASRLASGLYRIHRLEIGKRCQGVSLLAEAGLKAETMMGAGATGEGHSEAGDVEEHCQR